MVQSFARGRVVRVLAGGRVTIPAEFRRALGLDARTLLKVALVGDHIEVAPLGGADTLRSYTDEEIDGFLAEDKLDSEVATRIRRLLEEWGERPQA
jgi:bifunctional DNA-binding transcriptional regulator/antitoxin component of YhaV-PrlF toxin-antitoxin module